MLFLPSFLIMEVSELGAYCRREPAGACFDKSAHKLTTHPLPWLSHDHCHLHNSVSLQKPKLSRL